MIIIKKLSELQGAEKYGDCASCGKESSDSENYRIYFLTVEDKSKSNSVVLCRDCMQMCDVKMRLVW